MLPGWSCKKARVPGTWCLVPRVSGRARSTLARHSWGGLTSRWPDPVVPNGHRSNGMVLSRLPISEEVSRTMELRVEWTRSIPLKDDKDLIYRVSLDRLPTTAGVYVFGRRWGKQFEALYVGKANVIRGRVKGQLNNLRLMQHLKNAKAGKRILLVGRFVTKPGQRIEKCLPLVERALIRYFLSEGHDLVNKQGTRLRRHEISSSGKYPKRFFPSLMYVERGKGQ